MKKSAKDSMNSVSFRSTLRLLLGMVARLDPFYYVILFSSALFQAVNNLFIVFIPRILIDAYTAGETLPQLLGKLALLLLIKYGLTQLRLCLERQDEIHRSLLERKIPILFAEKITRMDYAMLENPQILDLKERAAFPLLYYGSLETLFHSSVTFLGGIVSLMGIGGVLLRFDLLFTLLLTLLSLIGLLLLGSFMKTIRKIQQEIIPINRRYGYYVGVATAPDFQKEFRIYGMSRILQKKIEGFTREMGQWLHKINLAKAKSESWQALVTALSRLLSYGYASVRLISDRFGSMIGLAQFSVVIGASEKFSAALRDSIGAVLNILQTFSHLQPFTAFMSLEETGSGSATLRAQPLETLRFENLSFSYPQSDRLILDRISFTLNKGEKISIVGLNNAGKSTLVKLICRLFEADSGRILWNDIDIRDYDYLSYIEQLSCVFQDFQIFPFSVIDNIAPRATSEDRERVWEILGQLEIDEAIRALPKQLDNYLDKSLYEEASDLSGGQKQKLAIARAIHKKASLVILDEPTAALDPLAESEIYENFRDLTRGQTAIFISHRMSSSIFCDKILLLQDGKIAALDSREALMKSDNLYRSLFETQAAHYRDSAI